MNDNRNRKYTAQEVTEFVTNQKKLEFSSDHNGVTGNNQQSWKLN